MASVTKLISLGLDTPSGCRVRQSVAKRSLKVDLHLYRPIQLE